MLYFYNLFFIILHPLLFIFLKIRVFKKKEDNLRYLEKLGYPSIDLTQGVIWIHVASLGEMKSIHSIIKHYQKKGDIKFLITSVTLSSYEYFKIHFENQNTFHQYAPIDSPIIISRFLKRWKPKLSIFIESEIWPNMIIKTSKTCKLILLNCRISKNSFKRWKLFRKTFIKIMNNFDSILAQSDEVLNYLKYFNLQNVKLLGNIKFTNTKKNNLNIIKINNNNFSWAAMSIHNSEIDFIIETHIMMNKFKKNLTTFLIPRHLNKIEKIILKIKNKNLIYQKISDSKYIENLNGIVILDQFGMAEDIFSQVKFTFMGGSTIDHGGQNPIEPLKYGCDILTGKYIYNFSEIYNDLINKKIVTVINNEKELANELIKKFDQKKTNTDKNLNLEFKTLSDEIFAKTTNFLDRYIY